MRKHPICKVCYNFYLDTVDVKLITFWLSHTYLSILNDWSRFHSDLEGFQIENKKYIYLDSLTLIGC